MKDQSSEFEKIVASIPKIGVDWHREKLLENSRRNLHQIKKSKSVDSLEEISTEKGLVISAGPSLNGGDALEILFNPESRPPLIAVDASLVKCLKAGIVPDYVVTLDPHPTRMVRWFGDPDFLDNSRDDDYFKRQDLNVDFREDSEREAQDIIRLVDQYAHRIKLVIASTVSENLVARVVDAGFELYWWVPLVDDPDDDQSLTREMSRLTGLPAFNTGGNVGSAAWVFTQFWLKIRKPAVIGMDLGYPQKTPYEMTQTYPELQRLLNKVRIEAEFFPETVFSQTGEVFFTDPTYYWYKQNLLELLENTGSTLFNCSGAGTLQGDRVICMDLSEYLVADLNCI